ncbi:cytochrome o ubiquinol oxidase subunit II [Arsenophonus nasoniae]|uniref:Ubiquinol oxidase subunit 2 n=1 Tax=Arsenophonus nasoniae TaxID=638 RepID=D2TWB9_9GAMM|nr:cytochrome o ubiquinol oxidase subunit II [Arsenophonus nasoniae]QBY44894.1 Cytochrome bo(3) ubiquinol oxidase subunit 2 [Arsenophonus nasoniae]WGL94590.1 cytochrome o ubiquinol oxidase subunit II [Arsenophonus nasoniae]WGM01048.1 cytochrome o ubiquinol oxidase subunit II [Arsenophonus nasoniae]WGM05134.1 cytochrome o ubiquinol oxidase subunit II [Arsenophonus nasoniae]WGM10146.1 cytochrome o ubiquinol oxidase subunit II [Arsenophonus nasoniae]
MRLIKYKGSIGVISLLAIVCLLTGCDMVLMDPKGAIGIEQRKLILTALGLMLIVVIPVIFMAIIFARKYRASNKQATYRPDWAHSNKIELVCWTVPIIIIIILAVITWKTTHQLDPYKPLESDKKPITIQVISTDWKWIFVYPEENIATVNEIAIPVGVPINFKVTAESVMNSFFIPALGGQIYAMAGMQTKLHLIANEPGTYKGFSSSYSGHGFSDMKFNVIATPDMASFDKWVQKVKASSKTLDSMATFNQLAKPSHNVPVTYFSSVKPNLYEELILKFGHEHHINHANKTVHEMSGNQLMHMNHSAHVDAKE